MNFQAGETWLRSVGRPLDVGLLDFQVHGEPQGSLKALESFANTDGGFGRALEPDVRLGDSSVIATTVGLQVLGHCHAASDHPLVEGAMRYLRSTFDIRQGAWPIVPTQVGDAAHAPWWEYRPASECLLNPRAEIVGYMYRWPGCFDDATRERLTHDVMQLLSEAEAAEMHDVLVLERMLHTPGFPLGDWAEAVEQFYQLAEAAVMTDPGQWGEYGLMPLTLIKDPANPLAKRLQPSLARNLEYLADTQLDDGSWAPAWSWFGSFESDWPAAERDIRSMVTADALCVLHRFGFN